MEGGGWAASPKPLGHAVQSPAAPRGGIGSTWPCLSVLCLLSVPLLHGKEHKRKVAAKDYGLGFSTEIAAPESEVLQAVEDVVNDGIIQGSKEFNKDKYIESATPATSSSLFPEWKGPGHVYYKVRTSVLAPLNFKESRDEGTVAVRYVVAEQRRFQDNRAD